MAEYDLGHIRDQLVNIQIGLTKTLFLIDDLLRAGGCAEEMEDDLLDEVGHPLQTISHDPTIGPVELRRAADLIKGMGSKPGDAKVDDRAQTRSVMGMTDKSIWLCPRCLTCITNLEYVHLNKPNHNGYCEGCDPKTKLEQYEKVEWRP